MSVEARIAQQLGDYRLLAQVGAGGMGEVYLAENVHARKRCAMRNRCARWRAIRPLNIGKDEPP